MRIVVICGTNREGAISRMLAREVASAYRPLAEVDPLDMSELPPEALHPTAYHDRPPVVGGLVERFLQAEGVVFVVPEYNGSFPGVLKLFVDMLPHPEGFEGRPCAFIGLSAGQFKSLRAVEHLQQVAGYRNAYIYPKRLFIGDSSRQFVDGKLVDGDLPRRLREQAEGFVSFIRAVKR